MAHVASGIVGVGGRRAAGECIVGFGAQVYFGALELFGQEAVGGCAFKFCGYRGNSVGGTAVFNRGAYNKRVLCARQEIFHIADGYVGHR